MASKIIPPMLTHRWRGLLQLKLKLVLSDGNLKHSISTKEVLIFLISVVLCCFFFSLPGNSVPFNQKAALLVV